MRFDIISANPKILESSLTNGLISRAVKKGLAEVKMHHLRDYAEGSYRQIDDIPYGGGTGMVLKPEPFFKCIKELTSERKYDSVIHFSPQGDLFNQKSANKFSLKENYILLCGHYKGIDQRVIDAFVTEEVSIGEYVISCGDIAALVFMDAVLRLVPGVLGDGESAITDTFQVETEEGEAGFDYPQYTRPEEYEGYKVPDVLLSGNHAKIDEWREQKASESFNKHKEKNKK
ncbi:MAG: tRNA (guanosine(37)-N1)-methyltransferase TrmD [Ignavibacteriae bacterium]|nr:tRNA (guanosine(37)-N1)-methyltransferase TrmD [Ignavibacteriota bacterium]MCB9243409.1 tRNA (guanosine(37)-N1)-methyltransferase TrmD [Ignavibacteriales bacterium]